MPMNRAKARELLHEFAFQPLFVDQMGWGSVLENAPRPIGEDGDYMRRLIAQSSGVAVLEVFPCAPGDGLPDAKTRDKLHQQIEKVAYENVLIFLDDDERRTQMALYWVKRENGKRRPRSHPYFKGQPGDKIMSQIDSMVIDMDELLPDGSLPLSSVIAKVSDALDIERVTKKFYSEFSQMRVDFVNLIEGIADDKDRYWYASVLLNRLMFIYFLQKKAFIQGNLRYLDDKLRQSQSRGRDRYYSEFLQALFFEGFAKPERQRDADARQLLGDIPYLNGGLFLRHKLESENSAIHIPDRAFANVLRLFGHYSWHLDDTPGARDNEINPDVLGYIFEKYINQKAFGAYYTRREITEYLCDKSIHAVILARVNQHSQRQFSDYYEAQGRLDADLCRLLLNEILPNLSILDPACGSGAFLVAAMKNLRDIYGAVYGRIDVLNDPNLRDQLERIRRRHSSLNYFIRKRIISDNLYGVDIMDEAAEIARLRLFLALVGAAQQLDDLEPLPNIDFNIMAGNSLIGLLQVDDARYLFQDEKVESYRREVAEKNRLIRIYRKAGYSAPDALEQLRRSIDDRKLRTYQRLNEILLDDFQALKIQYEQARLQGKARKRQLQAADMAALKPFHWGYEFDEIMATRGGFDVIITNPPWEVFKPQDEEFFAQYDDRIRQKRANRVEKRRIKAQLLEQDEIRAAYLDYQSAYRHVSAWYRAAPQYKNQISRVNGRKQGTDINLYKLFSEQCFNLLRKGGTCGIVIPSGIYSDLGAKQLRQMLFENATLTGLFGFQNRKRIFEDVVSLMKFVVLDFRKGGKTVSFPAAFMRHEVKDLASFPNDDTIVIDVDLIKRSSPSSLSITEFKTDMDVRIVEKMLRFPLLGEDLPDKWNIKLKAEFHMTNDSDLFHSTPGPGRLPLYEGKMIWQFQHGYAAPRYWIDEAAGRKRVLGRYGQDTGQTLGYQTYRLAHRRQARATDTRTFIANILPSPVFASDSTHVTVEPTQAVQLVLLTALTNSIALDWMIRLKVVANLNMFYLYQLPVPRMMPGDRFFDSIVQRAARLICTTPEYDQLAADVGLGNHRAGVIDPAQRAKLRAELDGMIAHIYGLGEDEFASVLGSFPLVEESVKSAALAAFRDLG